MDWEISYALDVMPFEPGSQSDDSWCAWLIYTADTYLDLRGTLNITVSSILVINAYIGFSLWSLIYYNEWKSKGKCVKGSYIFIRECEKFYR